MSRRADLLSTVALTLVCTVVVFVSAALGLLFRFGEWSYPEAQHKWSLVGLFAAAATTLALPAGSILWAVLCALDRMRALVRQRTLILILAVASLVWLYGLLTLRPITFYAHPLYLSAIAVSLLVLAIVARGDRPWRRSDVGAIAVVAILLVGVGGWLNFIYIRMAHDPGSSGWNAIVLALGFPLLGAGIRFGSLAKGTEDRPRSARRGWSLIAALVVLSAVALRPLYQIAYWAHDHSEAPALATEAGASISETGALSPEASGSVNVILISIDTLRADHLGIYGYERNTTPNIDRFFADGVVFDGMRSHAPYTLPAHTSMFTGLNISTHGVRIPPAPGGYIDRIPDELLTITEILSAAGYETAGFTGSGFVGRAYGFDQGFGEFAESESHRTRESVDRALDWLTRVEDRPFFLFLHGYDVHMFNPPRIYQDLEGEEYAGPLLEYEDVADPINADGFYEISDADIRYAIHLYDNELREVDTQLQRLFGFLERNLLVSTTVVVLTADHGQMFWENKHGGHSWDLYETLLRVPLVISAPAFRESRHVTDVAQTIDVAPTILDLVGMSESAAHMQGISLVPALGGGSIGDRPLIAEADGLDTKASITRGGYKYIHNGIVSHNPLDPRFVMLTVRALLTSYGTGEELYSLSEDPGEQHNLAEVLPDRTREYRELLFGTLRALDAASSLGDGDGTELTPELEAQLRELGYIR